MWLMQTSWHMKHLHSVPTAPGPPLGPPKPREPRGTKQSRPNSQVVRTLPLKRNRPPKAKEHRSSTSTAVKKFLWNVITWLLLWEFQKDTPPSPMSSVLRSENQAKVTSGTKFTRMKITSNIRVRHRNSVQHRVRSRKHRNRRKEKWIRRRVVGKLRSRCREGKGQVSVNHSNRLMPAGKVYWRVAKSTWIPVISTHQKSLRYKTTN